MRFVGKEDFATITFKQAIINDPEQAVDYCGKWS
jgi:hypothetical protein